MSSRSLLVSRVASHRFFKFSLVGVSGISVNMAMLYVGKEYLFSRVSHDFHGFDLSLNLALIFAISCSIVNNYTWNHHWTWHDRKIARHAGGGLASFGRYVVASWLGVAIQLALTNLLARLGAYYLFANLIAIGIVCIANFMLSDKWAFRIK